MFYILILIFSAFASQPTGFIGAFFAGIWFDIWQGNRLGSTSLLLMAIVLLVNLYKQRFNAASPGFLLPFTIVIYVGLRMIFEKQFLVSLHPYDILMQLVMTTGMYIVMTIVWRVFFTEKKLSV